LQKRCSSWRLKKTVFIWIARLVGVDIVRVFKLLGSSGRLLAFDRDLDAVDSAYARGMLEDKRFELKHLLFF